MKIMTRYFGEIEIEEKDIIRFPLGIIGFEEYKEYILIKFDPQDDTLFCLQALAEPSLGFVVISPYAVEPSYKAEIEDSDVSEIETDEKTLAELYAVVVVKEEFSESTVNMRCPIVVNTEKRLAKQVVLSGEVYSLRHPIVSA